MKTLMIHEKRTVVGATLTSNENCSETSESEEEFKTKQIKKPGLQEEEFELEKPTVLVAGKPYLYSKVSQQPELISLMTEEERENYISTCQEMFHLMYD